ncbi:type VII secretion protein EccB [Nocardia arthritidis]|uniref:type VII secretion protein EccB n=1 Tax=Nocardia arthritidis TaxID=228602 RepID=UPI00247FC9DA|nr:type VII secretion protein EccB [Nocardia arthritidis]
MKGKDATCLIWNKTRARVDMNEPAVTGASGIRGMTPRPIGEGLLNAIPEVDAIVPQAAAFWTRALEGAVAYHGSVEA